MGWTVLNRYKIKVYGKKSSLPVKNSPSDDVAFLHSVLTNDIKGLKEGEFNYNLMLKANGEPETDLFVYNSGDFFVLDTHEKPDIFTKKLEKLKLSLKVYFEKLEHQHIFIFGETAPKVIRDLPENFRFIKKGDLYIGKNPVRFGIDGFDLFGDVSQFIKSLPQDEKLTEKQMEDIRIKNCIPKIGKELRKGFHPLEANISYAFSFEKGCYTGQEAVARVYFRGRPPRTLVLMENKGKVKEGEKIISNGKPVGIITSVTSDGMFSLGYILRNLHPENTVFHTEKSAVKIIKQCEHKF